MRLFRTLLSTMSCWLGCADALVLTPFPDAGVRSGRAHDAAAYDGDVDLTPVQTARETVRSAATAADPSQQLASGPLPSTPPLEARFGVARDFACDLNGYWAAKQVLINQSELAGEQKTAQWSYLVIVQQGEELTVVDHHECGLLTRGVAEVVLPRDTLEFVVGQNSWRGRRGSVRRRGEHCDIRFQRAWSVRGADPQTFLPEGVFAEGELGSQAAVPLPTSEDLSGAEDWNGPDLARPGLAMSVSGAATGTRWTTQRLYSEWFTSEHYPVSARASGARLTLGAAFDSETHVLSVEPPSPLLQNVLPQPDGKNLRNKVELLLLGRDAADARAVSVVRERDLVKRCLHIQNVLLPY